VLQRKQIQTLVTSVSGRSVDPPVPLARAHRCRSYGEEFVPLQKPESPLSLGCDKVANDSPRLDQGAQLNEVDPLYLFACHIAWERKEEPTAGWELLAAAQSCNSEVRAHARALLSSSRHLGGWGLGAVPEAPVSRRRQAKTEDEMKGPYGLEITDNCSECTSLTRGFFCEFSDPVLQSLDRVSHKTTLPAGAILFVEGQAPRGMFMVCTGRVNLSTTSREGKILILKTANAGEALGLSATISGMGYEATAETATPCQVSFVDRKHYLELMQQHSEIGMHTSQCLSSEFRSAYHDIHDLILTRSSSGKLARLLLSKCRKQESEDSNSCATIPMTHEEMAQRIGASRETVTRLLSNLRKKRLIRLDGPTLVIRDRSALEALAV
jgi:CRP/FNR family transcriptional regulator, cyclic AMP receptor protein